MSDVNLNFVVENNSIDFTVQPNDITITPEEIQLTFNTSSQLNAGGSNTQLQYNNGNLLAGIPTATYNGSNLSLGNVGNIKITGGTNGFVLQTDGTGNLDWTAQTGGGGNGSPGGSNTQIQYNDSGSFGGNVGFTFNEVTGNVAIPGNLIVTGNISGGFVVANANFANYAGNAFSVSGSNVSGAVGLATFATTANAVAGANVSGEVNFAATANAVAGANVSGVVANANYSSYANIAASANSVAVANVSGIGNIATINLDGSSSNVLYGNGIFSAIDTSLISNGNSSVRIDTVNGPVQIFSNSTVTPVANFLSNGHMTVTNSINTTRYIVNSGGNISFNDGIVRLQTGANVTGGNAQIVIGANNPGNADFAIAIGNNTSTLGANSIAIGRGATANLESVVIGLNAGTGAGVNRRVVSIGVSAGGGSNGGSFLSGVAVGYNAGQYQQGGDVIAIGGSAGNIQEAGAIAIGGAAGNVQDTGAIAIGFASGANQGLKSVAIGQWAAQNNQGNFSIAVGANAGPSNQHVNTTILNSTGADLNSTQANSLFIKPIRDVTGNAAFTVTLKYNPTTGEIGYV
jgi:hypothetical protein